MDMQSILRKTSKMIISATLGGFSGIGIWNTRFPKHRVPFQRDRTLCSDCSLPNQHVPRRGGTENADVMMPLFGKALFFAHWLLITDIALFASFDLYADSLGLGSIEFCRRRRRRQPQRHRKVRKLQARIFWLSSNSVWSVLSVWEVASQVMEQKRAKQPRTWDVCKSVLNCPVLAALADLFTLHVHALHALESFWYFLRLQDVPVWWCWGSKVCWSVEDVTPCAHICSIFFVICSMSSDHSGPCVVSTFCFQMLVTAHFFFTFNAVFSSIAREFGKLLSINMPT